MGCKNHLAIETRLKGDHRRLFRGITCLFEIKSDLLQQSVAVSDAKPDPNSLIPGKVGKKSLAVTPLHLTFLNSLANIIYEKNLLLTATLDQRVLPIKQASINIKIQRNLVCPIVNMYVNHLAEQIMHDGMRRIPLL